MRSPRLRESVRALLLTPEPQLLLMQFEDSRGRRLVWLTPGGGVKEGEEPVDCLRRELHEETGLSEFEVGPLVWRREHTFRRGGGQRDRFYLVRTGRFEPSAERMGRKEHSLFRGFRWWSPGELEASRELFVPRAIGRYLRDLLDAGPPVRPVDVG